ncbi:MAG: hypothetical protein ACE5GT_14250, partial [Rhodospirillales bacterium]
MADTGNAEQMDTPGAKAPAGLDHTHVATLPTDPSDDLGAGGTAAVLTLDAPGEAARLTYDVQPNQVIAAMFDPALVQVGHQDGSLVLTFANGAEIMLDGFVAAVAAGQEPSLIFPDGRVLSTGSTGERAALGDEDTDLQVASGSTGSGSTITSPASAGGSHDYAENLGDFLTGLRAIDVLDDGAIPEGRGHAPGGPLGDDAPGSAKTASSVTPDDGEPAATAVSGGGDVLLGNPANGTPLTGNSAPPASNSAPTAGADSGTTNEDSALTLSVLGNDGDID